MMFAGDEDFPMLSTRLWDDLAALYYTPDVDTAGYCSIGGDVRGLEPNGFTTLWDITNEEVEERGQG
jgi:hypothetical protein